MCGIAGYISLLQPVGQETLEKMASACAHRGPDDSGIFVSGDRRTGLAHRRLSFLDLSETGKQPMANRENDVVVSFNGEIYNYLELRNELEKSGFQFRTKTDTEVLLHGYRAWGERLPEKLEGMFAFALYDERSKEVFLARDRFGIKPLFYLNGKNIFAFASEIKSFFAAGILDKKVRAESISLFLANRYIPAPYSIWEDVYKLKPGYSLTINTQTLGQKERQYWQLPVGNRIVKKEDAAEQFHILLRQSLSAHLQSDVPVGAFLSGGYDSSALVALMSREINYPTDAFSIGFKNWERSEDQYARIVADSVGAKLHTSIAEKIRLDSVKQLMWHYDDPIADISIIPTFEVSRLAAGTVKAVVSGEGADEALAGYWWHKPENFHPSGMGQKLRQMLSRPSFADIKRHYISAMSMGLFDRNELQRALGDRQIPDDPFYHFDRFRLEDAPMVKQLQYLDVYTFMSELILTKVDRASMAHSLEVRVPFLDHRLMTFLFSLDPKSYIEKGIQKTFLRSLLSSHVPAEILQRPKQGFVGPDEYYMDIAVYEKTLRHGRLTAENIIRSSYVDHLIASRDHWRLWKLFVLENWWQVWM